VIIREAITADIEEIVDKGEEFNSLLPIDCEYLPEYVSQVLQKLIDDETSTVLICEDMTGIVGFMLLVSYGFYLNPNYKLVSELCWWVDTTRRNAKIGSKLLTAAKAWSKHVGAKRLIMADISTSTDLAKFYISSGFSLKERNYYSEEL